MGKSVSSSVEEQIIINAYPLDFLRGRGQVDWRNAVRISLGRALRDHVRLWVGLGWAVICGLFFSMANRSWGYGITSSFLFSAFISLCSVIPWRIRLCRKRSLICTVILNGLLATLFGAIFFWFSLIIPGWLFLPENIFHWVLQHPVQITTWSLIYPLIGFGITLGEDQNRREQRREMRARRLKKLAEESRIIALRSQINPHFFFNALNTIAALIPTQPADAERAVELLAKALRPVLQGDQPLLATVESELSITQAYAEIEKLRLGDRLTVDFQVDDAVLHKKIPSLSLQPIFENAIRHGASKTSKPYTICLRIEPSPGGTTIELQNAPTEHFEKLLTSQLMPVPLKEGHSLHNIEVRSRALFRPEASLEVFSGDGQLGFVQLFIPDIEVMENKE